MLPKNSFNDSGFLPYCLDQLEYGHFYEDKTIIVFFGNKNFDIQNRNIFLDSTFHTLNQVHGSDIVRVYDLASLNACADSQYTSKRGLALAIRTADCLPVFLFFFEKKVAVALHAGWRGLTENIIKKTLQQVDPNKECSNLQAFIGPHIQQLSFAVDNDVAEKIAQGYEDILLTQPHSSKKYPSLRKVAYQQIRNYYEKDISCYFSEIDTFKNETYSSYRRDKTSNRNWSFILLK